ncbi:MAG TPA: encapsulin-associated ferritin-like protein [Planctomycetota bacterium]|nr:encapsulin-associated ferritin-like protein [Planctomycetota bacterium]
MANSVGYHEPFERLPDQVRDMHRALTSLQEELEAVDWYRQRAEVCHDAQLRDILLHNMREEVEHAAMVLEWLRRQSPDIDRHLRTYLFTEKPITEIEHEHEPDQE